MAMAAPTPMPTDSAILTLAQWLSPAYPVGGFAYSHGLEAAVEQGWVADAQGLRPWLEDVLLYGGGYNDALFLAAAYRATTAGEVAGINATALAFAASKERRVETLRQGRAFCTVTGAIWADMPEALAYPVAVGHGAARNNLPQGLATKMYVQAFVANLVAAAQRLLPLGQTDAQRLLHAMQPHCEDLAEAAASGDLSQLSATAFLSDIAAMKHETQYSRIFTT